MSKIRYVVAMVRRDDPVKTGMPYTDKIRSEFPLEDLYRYMGESLTLPEKKGLFKSKRYKKDEVDKAFTETIRSAVSKAYSWLINNRVEEK